jgi:hypothetical protein
VVVALEGLHESLGDAVGFRAADRGEARHEADRVGEGERLVGGEAAAVVGKPFHRLWRYEGAEGALDRKQHTVTHGDPADAAGAGRPGEDLAIVGVDGERDPHRVAIPALGSRTRRRPSAGSRQTPHLAVGRPLASTRCEGPAAGPLASSRGRHVYHLIAVNPGLAAEGSLSSTRSAVPPSPWRQIVGSPNVIHAVD